MEPEDLQREDWDGEEERDDPALVRAVGEISEFFESRHTEVFFSRQVEVLHERSYFHWISNRAIRAVREQGEIRSERRDLATGGHIQRLWHRSLRYWRRPATRLVRLVEEYAAPNIGAALGLQGEALVLEGFARQQFVLHGRSIRAFRARESLRGEYDLDFIFERDGESYGVEVKNTLGYRTTANSRPRSDCAAI